MCKGSLSSVQAWHKAAQTSIMCLSCCFFQKERIGGKGRRGFVFANGEEKQSKAFPQGIAALWCHMVAMFAVCNQGEILSCFVQRQTNRHGSLFAHGLITHPCSRDPTEENNQTSQTGSAYHNTVSFFYFKLCGFFWLCFIKVI